MAAALGIGAGVAAAGGPVLPEGFRAAETLALEPGAVAFAELPDGRILTAAHASGRVDLYVGGERRETPIFVVPDLLVSSEQGLLGIAIDPDHPAESWVYLFYTHADSTNRVSRFPLEGELTDGTSFDLGVAPEEHLLWYGPSTQRFHNGGTLRFGSDRTLYISHGDDALSTGNVQNLAQLHGKILRINRDGSIPADNPVFPEEPADMREEIFAFGLRNPFRFCMDPSTDELLIGDVGGVQVEELSLCRGGENFGYPFYEGSEVFRDETPLIPPVPTFPIAEYGHSAPQHAIIALAGYRPSEPPRAEDFPPEYDGTWFWSEFYAETIWSLRPDGGGGWTSVAFATGFSKACDAALARSGGLWVLRYGTTLTRIVHDEIVPVLFLDLDAQADGDRVRLDWRTSEAVERFEVTRSETGEAFEVVGEVPADGNAHAFTDETVPPHAVDLYYRLVAHAAGGDVFSSPVVRVAMLGVPSRPVLRQNQPNPFGARTVIRFGVPEAERGVPLRLEVFDVGGRRVRTLLDAAAFPGREAVEWDGRDDAGHVLPSGVYTYRLTLGDISTARRLVVAR